jgi:hypothetical protein
VDPDDLDLVARLDLALLDAARDDRPRPVIVKTSSIGIRNGLSTSRSGSGMYESTASMSSRIFAFCSSSPSSAFSAEPVTIGMSSPGNSYRESSSRTSISTSSSSSGSSTMSALFRNTTMYGTLDLAGEQDVLARLGHRAVGGRDDEDRAVHLGGARDHVLDVVGVTRAVDVRVVTVVRLVLDVRRVDRDAAGLLLGALSIDSKLRAVPPVFSASTDVIAAVSVVLPWSM